MSKKKKQYTSSGTDINQVKRQNAQANNKEEFSHELGLEGNKSYSGQTMAGTNVSEVKKQNAQAGNGKSAAFSSNMMEEFAEEVGLFSSGSQPSSGNSVLDYRREANRH